MKVWKKRLNNYGLSDSIIIFLSAITVVAVIAEMVSIGMFLPLFEMISQYGSEGLENSESDVVDYMNDFMHVIGLELTIEILLISSFVLFLFSKVLLYVTTYVQLYYNGLIIKNMKDRLLHEYLQADPSYYDTVGIGNFTNNSFVELPSAVGGVMLPIKLITTIMSGIGSIILLLLLSPELTLISICVISIGTIIPARWVKATTKVGQKNTHYRSVVTSFLLDRLQSPRLVRLSNTANAEEESYTILTEKHRNLTLAIQILKARISLVLEPMIIGISLSMFYVALVYLEMNISTILLYMVVMVRILPIATSMLTQKQGINRAYGSIQAIDKLSNDINKSIKNRTKNTLSRNLISEISKVDSLRLENANFHYNNCENNVLSDINHTLKKSSLTAIVGPSGSGKTTFVDIISGYRQLVSGTLLVNEVDIDKYNPESLMSLVSYVPQVPQIFDGITIYEHIAYGKPNSTKDEVINASKLSGAYDFIKELPQEFDTVLTGSSSGLSGGQKQRLDLSRALLRDTPILIMDEPTGNLDLISEKKLMLSINKIREATEKIIIIIAHRVYTVMDADQIIVLEDGKISGVGTHTELLLSNSWYPKAVKELQL